MSKKKKNTRELKQRLRRQQRERQIVISLIRQITTHAFLYISLRLLHDYNVKLPSLKIGDCEEFGKGAEIGKLNHEAKKKKNKEGLRPSKYSSKLLFQSSSWMKAIAIVLKHTFWLGYGQSFGHQDCPGSGEKPSCFRNWLQLPTN